MREALTLSCKYYLRISTDNSRLPLDINIGDLRTGLVFPPATNVKNYGFKRVGMNVCGNDPCLFMHSLRLPSKARTCTGRHALSDTRIIFTQESFLHAHAQGGLVGEEDNHPKRVLLASLPETYSNQTESLSKLGYSNKFPYKLSRRVCCPRSLHALQSKLGSR